MINSNKKDTHPKQIQHIAHAIIQNLEKYVLFQVLTNMSQPLIGTIRSLNQNEERENLKQGDTIKSDSLIASTKIYTDAAWKTKKALGSQGQTASGISVFFHFENPSGESKVMIQATSPTAPSPLMLKLLLLSLLQRSPNNLTPPQ
jgi:hypothetical protein